MRVLPLAVLLVASPVLAQAQTFSYSVDLTPASPTYNRAIGLTGLLSDSGSNVPYVVVPITVPDGNNFSMVATGGTHSDAYMFVYNNFDPTDATLGRVLADDDGGSGLLPAIGPSLGDPVIANGDYDVVITAFANNNYGTLDFDIFGITLNIGPAITELARDLTLQNALSLLVSAQGRTQAIAAAQRQTSGGMGGAVVSSSGHGGIKPRLWVSTSNTNLNEDVTGSISRLQLGMDKTIQSGATLGVALSFDKFDTATPGTSAEGMLLALQPYFATTLGPVDAVFALSFGKTDYTDYTFGDTIGEANGRAFEVSANFERTIDMGNDISLRPFAQLGLGLGTLDFEGGLAAAPSEDFTYRHAALGAELSKGLSGADLAEGSAVYGRLSLNHASSTAPDDSFVLTTPERDTNFVTLALGVDLAMTDGISLRLEAVTSGTAQGKPDMGVTGGLSIRF